MTEKPTNQADETEGVPAKEGKAMGFLDHLEELRGTLIKCAVVSVIFAVLIGYYLREFSGLLMWPWDSVRADFPQFTTKPVTMSMMGIFTMAVNTCLFGSAAVSLPFWFFFVSQFIAPALSKKELKVLVPTCFSALVLFVLGASFGFFLLVPSTVRVSYEMHAYMNVDPMWTIESYYGLLFWLVLGVGATFEFPLLVVLAVYMGLVEVATLRKYWRHAFVIIFIMAAFITPTTDPINMCLFALPLMVLYVLAIVVASRITRRRKDQVIEV